MDRNKKSFDDIPDEVIDQMEKESMENTVREYMMLMYERDSRHGVIFADSNPEKNISPGTLIHGNKVICVTGFVTYQVHLDGEEKLKGLLIDAVNNRKEEMMPLPDDVLDDEYMTFMSTAYYPGLNISVTSPDIFRNCSLGDPVNMTFMENPKAEHPVLINITVKQKERINEGSSEKDIRVPSEIRQ